MNWFARFWRRRRPSRTARPAPTFRPTVDGLDERVMPAVFGGRSLFAGALFGPATAGHGDFSGANLTQLSAALTGTSGSGHAHATVNATAGTSSLSVNVTGLTANTTYSVEVNGTTVGEIATNANGAANVRMSGLATTIAAGDTLAIADSTGTTVLSGTFAAPSITRLSASLTGTTGSGHARYHADATAGTNSLTVSVSGLTASTTYNVDIGTSVVGQITTDANGDGSVTLSGLTTSVAAGSTISVVTSGGTTVLSGTFATATGGGHGCHGG